LRKPQTASTPFDKIGPRLRDLRHRHGLTLAELGRLTGVSVSTLSRLESGLRKPTLDLLLPLGRIYGASLDELAGLCAVPEPFRRHDVTFVPLSRRDADVLAFKSTHPGRAEHRPVAHAGRDWLYVLRGRLRLTLGDREHLLSAGEAAEFDTRIPHALASADESPVEVLNLLSRGGHRVDTREL
jgi:transcriptional regulator with XRE-family HTH domain